MVAWIGTSMASAQVQLNEIRTGESGPDINEFFEIRGASGTSLAGYSYVVLGDSPSGGSGVVTKAIPLTGSIPASSHYVVATSTFTLGVPDQLETLGFADGVNRTHFLVTGFTGNVGQDLDLNDNGTLDVTPWSAVTNSVAFYGTSAPSTLVYSNNYVGIDAVPSPVPSATRRCTGGWLIGDDSPSTFDSPGADNGCGFSTSSFCDPGNINSTGFSCWLYVVPNSIAESGIRLEVTGGRPQEFGYFLVGSGTNTANPIMVSSGSLCLSNSPGDFIGRYNHNGTNRNSIGQFDANNRLQNLVGTSSTGYGFDVPNSIPFPSSPTVTVGQSLHFQLWYRDRGAIATSGLSNGITVRF